MTDRATSFAKTANPRTADVSIVMCTVDRFDMADRTITSVLNQENRLALRFEMIVVDNSEAALSRDRIAAAAVDAPVPLRYVHEPRRNISHARNAGIAASAAEFVAFIDDDEIAPANWIDTMVAAARTATADVVIGPVYPSFEGGSPPDWDPEGQLPVRDLRLPTGTPVTDGPTCNILFRTSTCFSDGQSFDPAFGLTGGSDTDFTVRLHRRGLLLVWCADSVITEFQPRSRMTLRYWSRRMFTKNQTYTRCMLGNSSRPVADLAYIMASGAFQVAVFSIPFVISTVRPTPGLVRMRFAFLRGAGKLLYLFRVNFY